MNPHNPPIPVIHSDDELNRPDEPGLQVHSGATNFGSLGRSHSHSASYESLSPPVNPIVTQLSHAHIPPLSPQYNEFAVKNLGPCTIESPLLKQNSCVNFIHDSEAILENFSSSGSDDDLAGRHRIQKAGPRSRIYFNPEKTRVGIITCGGVSPGLNNVIRNLQHILFHRYGVSQIYGFRYGFQGLAPTSETFEPIELTPSCVRDIHQFGGTILGTSRGPQDTKVMVDYLVSKEINLLFALGGDGTQKGAHALAEEIQRRNLKISIVGIGKTIDNDLLYVDRSFGFETAVTLAQSALISAHEEARSCHNGIGIVKLFGRESGAIALHASLANGDVNVLLVPEIKCSVDDIVEYLIDRFKTRDHALIVCAEGAFQDEIGDSGKKDKSGNKIFVDVGLWLKDKISEGLKKKNVPHTMKYIDPSYQIRAGVACPTDAILCSLYAQMAAHAGMCGKTDMMVGMMHGEFVHLPLSKVTEGRKKVDIKGLYFQALLDATGSPFYKAAESSSVKSSSE